MQTGFEQECTAHVPLCGKNTGMNTTAEIDCKEERREREREKVREREKKERERSEEKDRDKYLKCQRKSPQTHGL